MPLSPFPLAALTLSPLLSFVPPFHLPPVNLQVGQAGNQLGSAFWEQLLMEHGLDHSGQYVGEDPQQLVRSSVYFTEAGNDKYVPRSIQIDLEPGTMDTIKSGSLGRLFSPNTFISGQVRFSIPALARRPLA